VSAFQMHFHAIGAKGVKVALDAISDAASDNSTADIRHRVTHAYFIDAADPMRFDDLGFS
jgi:predicted amidohydrolase YtcJ